MRVSFLVGVVGCVLFVWCSGCGKKHDSRMAWCMCAECVHVCAECVCMCTVCACVHGVCMCAWLMFAWVRPNCSFFSPFACTCDECAGGASGSVAGPGQGSSCGGAGWRFGHWPAWRGKEQRQCGGGQGGHSQCGRGWHRSQQSHLASHQSCGVCGGGWYESPGVVCNGNDISHTAAQCGANYPQGARRVDACVFLACVLLVYWPGDCRTQCPWL
jgi:hypothetical protein